MNRMKNMATPVINVSGFAVHGIDACRGPFTHFARREDARDYREGE